MRFVFEPESAGKTRLSSFFYNNGAVDWSHIQTLLFSWVKELVLHMFDYTLRKVDWHIMISIIALELLCKADYAGDSFAIA
jgi:hypothetical protein